MQLERPVKVVSRQLALQVEKVEVAEHGEGRACLRLEGGRWPPSEPEELCASLEAPAFAEFGSYKVDAISVEHYDVDRRGSGDTVVAEGVRGPQSEPEVVERGRREVGMTPFLNGC